jgi:photosystem II stability/assembly factor-like uncharacterized protein
MEKTETSNIWWQRALLVLFTSITILSSAASCNFFGGGDGGGTVLGVIKRDPEIKEEGFGFINQEKLYTGELIPNGLASASGLKIAQADSDKLYLLTQDQGFFQTVDGGRTWERKYVFGFEGTATEQREVQREIQTWERRNDRFVGTDFAIDPNNGDVVYVAGQFEDVGRIYKTEDGGSNFRQVYTSVEEDGFTRLVTIDPQNTQNIYALVGQDTIIRSQNGGDTWRKMHVFTRETVVQIGFYGRNSNTLFALIENEGLAFSQDQGASWEVNPLGKGETLVGENTGGEGIFDINNNDSESFRTYEKVVPVNNGGSWLLIADQQIWFSRSIRNVFQKILLPTEAVQYETYDIAPYPGQAPDRLLVAVNDKLFETRDGGITWSTDDKIGLQSDIGNIGQVLIDENNPEIVYLMLVDEDVVRRDGLYQETGGGGFFS